MPLFMERKPLMDMCAEHRASRGGRMLAAGVGGLAVVSLLRLALLASESQDNYPVVSYYVSVRVLPK